MTNALLQKEASLVEKLHDEKGLNFHQISDIMGFSARTAGRRYQLAKLEDAVEEALGDEEEVFPETPELVLPKIQAYLVDDKGEIERFKPLVVEGDAIVTSDFHIPLHDPSLVNALITAGRRCKIKTLLIGGDFFHMEEFSNYPPFQPEANLMTERRDGNVVIKTLLKTFDEIHIIWGNHDFRLSKKLGFKKTFTECMEWMLGKLTEDERKRVHISDLDYMYYYPTGEKGRKFRVCHPRDFSAVPLYVGRKLAVKYSCSVITAHSHHCAIGVAQNGYDIVIEAGGFYDKDRTEYIQRTTGHHEWVQGFTIFKDGVPTLISPVFGNDKMFRKEVKT